MFVSPSRRAACSPSCNMSGVRSRQMTHRTREAIALPRWPVPAATSSTASCGLGSNGPAGRTAARPSGDAPSSTPTSPLTSSVRKPTLKLLPVPLMLTFNTPRDATHGSTRCYFGSFSLQPLPLGRRKGSRCSQVLGLSAEKQSRQVELVLRPQGAASRGIPRRALRWFEGRLR